jgi:hypothetical protein
MKRKPLFNFNIVHKSDTIVYIVLPDVKQISFNLIKVCIEFLSKYDDIIFICSPFEYMFFKLLFTTSKSLADYKRRIGVQLSHPMKFREIQSKECLILYLHHDSITVENHKVAILCQLNKNSDIIFNGDDFDSEVDSVKYIKTLLNLIGINEENKLNEIELAPEMIVKTSAITGSLKVKDFHAIFIQDMLTARKISSLIRKQTLKHHLIIISKKSISIDNPKVHLFKDYDLLDYIALQLQSKSISSPNPHECRTIMNNLKVKLPLFNTFKDINTLLYDVVDTRSNA